MPEIPFLSFLPSFLLSPALSSYSSPLRPSPVLISWLPHAARLEFQRLSQPLLPPIVRKRGPTGQRCAANDAIGGPSSVSLRRSCLRRRRRPDSSGRPKHDFFGRRWDAASGHVAFEHTVSWMRLRSPGDGERVTQLCYQLSLAGLQCGPHLGISHKSKFCKKTAAKWVRFSLSRLGLEVKVDAFERDTLWQEKIWEEVSTPVASSLKILHKQRNRVY